MEISAKLFEEVVIFATESHKGQTRRDGKPYILHPMEVMAVLASVKKSSNPLLLSAVCLLHDVVEDCDVPIREITHRFGLAVSGMVQELTSNESEIEKIGKAHYLAKKMTKMSSYSLGIKLADRYTNLESPSQNKIEETRYILDYIRKHRVKLTKTHKKLMKMIEKRLK
jgi:guanosine-3',5'-bis(diphosphate) 3'-pyrophosphohydrolase